jgi:hypothetical protein
LIRKPSYSENYPKYFSSKELICLSILLLSGTDPVPIHFPGQVHDNRKDDEQPDTTQAENFSMFFNLASQS